jgi:RHS repeat-associated protein
MNRHEGYRDCFNAYRLIRGANSLRWQTEAQKRKKRRVSAAERIHFAIVNSIKSSFETLSSLMEFLTNPTVVSRRPAQCACRVNWCVESLEQRINFGNGWDFGPEVPLDLTPGPPCPQLAGDSSDNPNSGYNNNLADPSPYSDAPVNYTSGLPLVTSTDLLSTGFGKDFGIVRSWTGLNQSSAVGNGWAIESLPYLVVARNQYSPNHGGIISIVEGGQTQESFDIDEDDNICTPRYASQDTLVYHPEIDVAGVIQTAYFAWTDTSGDVITFNDLPREPGGGDGDSNDVIVTGRIYGGDAHAQSLWSFFPLQHVGTTVDEPGPAATTDSLTILAGAFRGMTDAGGNVTDAIYDPDTAQLKELDRSDPSGAQERFYFTYSTISNSSGGSASMVSDIAMQQRANSTATWTTVRTADYDYYTGDVSDGDNGRLGDLKHVVIKDYQTNPDAPIIVSQDYYTYYKMSGTSFTNAGNPANGPSYLTYTPTNDPSTTGGEYDSDFPALAPETGDTQVMSGIRTVVEGSNFDALQATYGSLSNISTLSDAQLAPFAQYTFQYGRYAEGDFSQGLLGTSYRVIEETAAQSGCSVCADGFGTFTYSYTVNPYYGAGSNFDGGGYENYLEPNTWVTKNVQTLPDDTPSDPNDNDRIITYTNEIGEVLLQAVVDSNGTDSTADDRVTLTAYQYDTDGRLILEAMPSAIKGYSESEPDLVDFDEDSPYLQSATGQLKYWNYAYSTSSDISSTTGGDVQGYLQQEGLREGFDGTDIPTEAWTYYTVEGNGATIHPTASDITYGGTGSSDARETDYAYTYYSDTTQALTETVQNANITSTQNGPGVPSVETYVFDTFGRTIASKDANGFVDLATYDPYSGAVLTQVIDASDAAVNATIPSNVTLSRDSSVPALGLTTIYTVDKLGRVTSTEDPNGQYTYTRYDDLHHAVFTFSPSSSGETAPPIEMSRTDIPYTYTEGGTTHTGTYDEVLTLSGTPTLSGGVPVTPQFESSDPELLDLVGSGTLSSPQFTIQSLTRTLYNSAGQAIEVDAYSEVTNALYLATSTMSPYSGTSGTNYNATTYRYDGQGRVNRVEDPNGTITRTLYDARGDITSVWVGTDDQPTIGYWSPSNGTGTNLVEVTKNIYDGEFTSAIVGDTDSATDSDFTVTGTVTGDGNLTETIQYPRTVSGDERITLDDYNWRDELVATKQGASSDGTETDGVNRPITINIYDNAGEVTATYTFDGDGVPMTDTDSDGVPDTLSGDLVTPGSGAAPGLVAYSTSSYDDQGRIYESTVYPVDAANGTIGSTGIVTDTWYDNDGNVLENHTSGGAFTKTVYDGADRPTVVYTTDGGSVLGDGTPSMTWSSANSVSSDIVLTQTQTIYDGNGNVVETITKDRDNNDGNIAGVLGSQTITIPAADSPTGANLTLTWVADVWNGGGEDGVVDPGYTNVSNLSIVDTPASGVTAVWLLPPTAAADYGFSGDDWAFVVNDHSSDYIDGEYANVSNNPAAFSNGTVEDTFNSPPSSWANMTAFSTVNTSKSGLVAARVSYTASYYDAAGRDIANVNVGTNEGTVWTRPGSIPSASNTTLVTLTTYNAAGYVDTSSDPNQSINNANVSNTPQYTKYYYDSLGQVLYQVAAWDGSYDPTTGSLPPASSINADQTTATTYDGDGNTLTLTALLPAGQASETTLYNYGVTTAGGSSVNSNDLLSNVIYGASLFTGTGSSDAITIERTTSGGNTVEISDATHSMNIPLSALSSIVLSLGTGNATVTFNETNGDITLPSGLLLNGSGNVTLDFVGGNFTLQQDEGTYAPNLTIDLDGGSTVTMLSNENIPYINVNTGCTLNIDADADVTQWPNQAAFTYNALGQTITKTDQNGTEHTYTYDSLGRQTLDSVTTLAAGVDGSIRAIGTTYNAQGLVDTQTSYSVPSANSSDIVNQVENLYNDLGQLVQQYQSPHGAVITSGTNATKSVHYAYSDPSSGALLTSMTYPSGQVINYSYGTNGSLNAAIGRLDSLSETVSGTTTTLETYQYLGLSTVVVRAQPQAVDELTYLNTGASFSSGGTSGGDEYTGLDAFGRVADQKWDHVAIGQDGNIAYSTIDEYQYTYDANGNVVAKVNPLHTVFNETYTYDDLDQLANMTRGGSAYQSWNDDALGNMDSVTSNGTTSTNTLNSQNELTGLGSVTLGYDNDGNTTTDNQGNTLVYDAWNRLVKVINAEATSVETYTYDAQGHRVTETPAGSLEKDLYYSNQWQVIEEDTSNSGLHLHADYVWSPVFVDALILRDDHLTGTYDGSAFNFSDRLYATQDANYNVTALVAYTSRPGDTNGDGEVDLTDLNNVLNHLGTTVTPWQDGDTNGDGRVDLTDLNNVLSELGTTEGVTERFVYDAYGASQTYTRTWAATTDAYAWQYKFQGGRYDSTTGLYDFRNREYSPTMMRWTTQDPLGYVDGMNDYGFVGGDPISLDDPQGLQPKDQRYGLPNDFWDWYHNQRKQKGEPDLTRPEAEEEAEEWRRQGKPRGNGNRPRPDFDPNNLSLELNPAQQECLKQNTKNAGAAGVVVIILIIIFSPVGA